MRKSLSIILAASLALCISCTKQEIQGGEQGSGTNVPTDGDIDYITAVAPGTPVKTVVNNDTKVFWESGDKIGMYSDGGTTAVYTTKLDAPSPEANFGRTSDNMPAKVGDMYYAVYPSSAVSKWGLTVGETAQSGPFCYVNVPKLQTAVNGSWDPKAGILAATSSTNQLAFKHAVAYVRFEVTDQTGEFSSVRLLSNNKETISDSQASVQYGDAGEVLLSSGAAATDYVTLRNTEGSSTFAPGAYYIAIVPGEFSAGLTLSFTDAKGLVAEHAVGQLTLNAGEVSDWGQIPALTFAEGKTPLQIATVFTENDIKQGVVYWIDPNNPYKGKVISVSSAETMDWSENYYQGYLWTDKIQSQDDGLLNYNQFHSSEVYTSQMEKFYAMNYCEKMRETHGGNWYLPAPKELRTLCQTYYALSEIPPASATVTDYRFENSVLNQSAMNAKADFDAALRELGETTTATLDGDANGDGVSDNNGYGTADGVSYWSSKVNTGGEVQYVNIGAYYVQRTGKLPATCYVRCVRDVEIGDNGGSDDSGDSGESGDDSGESGEGGANPGGGDDNGEGGDDSGNTGGGDDTGGTDPEDDMEDTTPGIDPLNPFDIFYANTIRVSLVGDSITTFEGTLVTNFPNSENNGAYYPTGNVTSVENQYWHKLIYGKMHNAVLDVNNSLRGSMVIRRTQENYLNVDYTARVSLYGLGNPDVVFIHGGTNDCTKHSDTYAIRPGMYRADLLLSDDFLKNSFDKGFVDNPAYTSEPYKGMAPASVPTDAEFNSVFTAAEAADTWEEVCALEDRSFIHAYVKLVNMIHFKHPNAKVVMIIGDALTKRAQQAILKIAEHYEQLYGYKCVNFFGLADSIGKASGVHPNDAGFTFMADKIYEEVGSYIDAR